MERKNTWELYEKKQLKELEKLNIGNDYNYELSLNDEEIKDLIIKSLKLKNANLAGDNLTEEFIKLSNISLKLMFDNSKNEEEIKNNLLKEQTRLINSINRRKNLLSNENYLKKAPSNIVENETEALKKEEEQLSIINEKLK